MLPVGAAPVRDGAVAIAGGRVLAVGPAARVAAAHPELPERHLGDAVVMPGLVDAHCHLEWSLAGGLVPAGPFPRWIGGMLALARRMRPGDALVAARNGALTALQAGTTTLADIGPAGAGVAALGETGQRGIVHPEVFGREQGAAAREAAARAAQRAAILADAAGPRVSVGLAPHAPYSVGPDLWRALAARPDLAERPWATHLAECPDELGAISDGAGPLAAAFAALGIAAGRWPGTGGAAARVASEGGMPTPMVAAHCVQIDRRDIDVLAGAGTAVAHCPISNGRLECGRAPVELLRAAGVIVALGTDSPASAGAYDLRAEARACRAAHAAAGVEIDARELVAMMTSDGAAALALADRVGSLAPGMEADLLALRAGPGGWTTDDPYERALDPDARPTLVLCAGVTLLDDSGPRLVDRHEVLARADEARAALC